MPKQRAAQASTRHPTQLSSFSEARAEVMLGSTRGDEAISKHEKESDNLARIDRKIEADNLASTLRPAPPEAASGSRPPARQPRAAAQATSPGGERMVDMGRLDGAGQQPLVYAAHHGDVEVAFSLLDLTLTLTAHRSPLTAHRSPLTFHPHPRSCPSRCGSTRPTRSRAADSSASAASTRRAAPLARTPCTCSTGAACTMTHWCATASLHPSSNPSPKPNPNANPNSNPNLTLTPNPTPNPHPNPTVTLIRCRTLRSSRQRSPPTPRSSSGGSSSSSSSPGTVLVMATCPSSSTRSSSSSSRRTTASACAAAGARRAGAHGEWGRSNKVYFFPPCFPPAQPPRRQGKPPLTGCFVTWCLRVTLDLCFGLCFCVVFVTVLCGFHIFACVSRSDCPLSPLSSPLLASSL